MVLMAGLGGVPFFFVRGGMSQTAAGLSTALAAGVMLSASRASGAAGPARAEPYETGTR